MGWGICLVRVPGRRGQLAPVAWGAGVWESIPALTSHPGPEGTILPAPSRPSVVTQTVVGGRVCSLPPAHWIPGRRGRGPGPT